MTFNTRKNAYNPLTAFNDSSLPNQEGKPISVERSQILEDSIMPQLDEEIAKLHILRPDLFKTNKSQKLAFSKS